MIRNLIFINKTFNNLSKEVNICAHKCVNFISKYEFCNKCVSICDKNAINIDKHTKKITINSNLCTHCGLCVNICPTGVFEFKYYKFIDLLNSIDEYANTHDTIRFICEKFTHYSTTKKTNNAIKIPCIGLLDYSLLIHMFLYYSKDIIIYSNCKTCVNNKSLDLFHILLKEITDFLDYFDYKCPNIDFIESLTQKRNINNDLETHKNSPNLTRRELFQYYKKQFVSSTKHSLSLLKEETNIKKQNNKLQKTLPINRKLFLRDLHVLLNIKSNVLINKNFSFFKKIRIDTTKCNLCSICYVLCPTGALSEKSEEDGNNISRKIGVNIFPERCISCDLCINICPKKATSYYI